MILLFSFPTLKYKRDFIHNLTNPETAKIGGECFQLSTKGIIYFDVFAFPL